MKIILQIGLVLGICLLGEALSLVLPIPFPGSVIAMIFLFLLLLSGRLRPEHIREKWKAEGRPCTLANARFVKPVDTVLIDRLAEKHDKFVTLEENVLQGGFGLQVTAYIHQHYPHIKVLNIALPDAYVEHGNVSKLREALGIDSDSVVKKMKAFFGGSDERTS